MTQERIIPRPTVHQIELARVTDNDIIFRCPSESFAGVIYDITLRNNGMQVYCQCPGFHMAHAKHHPSQLDRNHHCRHIRAAVEYLDSAITIEEMDAELEAEIIICDCGAGLEEKRIGTGAGEKIVLWCHLCGEAEVSE